MLSCRNTSLCIHFIIVCIFAVADAVFILSFSTIMLNTDLHNPNMKDEKRMTIDQFLRNNRGINDGSDLPVEFLTDLYFEIKNEEIQLKKDLDDVVLQGGIGDASDIQFDGLLSKASDVATPFFTPAGSARHKFVQAGVHERDMFLSISSAAIKAISSVFVQSWDDALVMKALDGLRNSANICFYFGLNYQFNFILETLLGFGLDYVSSISTLVYYESPEVLGHTDIEAELLGRDFPPIPKTFLSRLDSDDSTVQAHFDIGDVAGLSLIHI